MKKGKRKNFVIKILKIQTWITILFIVAYAITLSLGTKENFFTDLYDKRQVASAMITATMRIFGPPSKVSVSGSVFCDKNGRSAIKLEWPLATDATSYDIWRRGEDLVSGLKDNFFVDINVIAKETYLYKVISSGPAGVSVSDAITVVAKNCTTSGESFVVVNVFEGKNLSQIKGIPSTKNKKPVFQGQTNIPFAIIEAEIHSSNIVYGTTQANVNGYWKWSLPVKISSGLHELRIKAIDPNNPNNIASSYLIFKIVKEGSDEIKDNKVVDDVPGKEDPPNNIQSKLETPKEKPFDLDVSVENSAGNDIRIKSANVYSRVYRGKNIKAKIEFSGSIKENSSIEVNYKLIDSDGEVVTQYSEESILGENLTIEKSIPSSLDLKLGKYKLIISATINDVTVSDESSIFLKEQPLIKINETDYLTYDDLISNLSWLIIGSATILSLFSIATFMELYLCKRAKVHITGRILKKKGFIK